MRKVIIPDVAYTYCDNCKYDDFGDKVRKNQLSEIVSGKRISCSIWIGGRHKTTGWDNDPHNHRKWDVDEWEKQNSFVMNKFPELRGMSLFSNVDAKDPFYSS